MTDAVPGVAPAEDAAVPVSSAPTHVDLADGWVELHPKVTIPIGIAALSVIKQGGGQAVIEAGLAEVYLRYGIARWSFPDAVTPEAIATRLPYGAGGLEVAEAADALYSEDVIRPLALRLARSLPSTPPPRSTSASSRTGSKHQTHSGRSSRNGTAGKP